MFEILLLFSVVCLVELKEIILENEVSLVVVFDILLSKIKGPFSLVLKTSKIITIK